MTLTNRPRSSIAGVSISAAKAAADAPPARDSFEPATATPSKYERAARIRPDLRGDAFIAACTAYVANLRSQAREGRFAPVRRPPARGVTRQFLSGVFEPPLSDAEHIAAEFAEAAYKVDLARRIAWLRAHDCRFAARIADRKSELIAVRIYAALALANRKGVAKYSAFKVDSVEARAPRERSEQIFRLIEVEAAALAQGGKGNDSEAVRRVYARCKAEPKLAPLVRRTKTERLIKPERLRERYSKWKGGRIGFAPHRAQIVNRRAAADITADLIKAATFAN